MNGTHRMRDGIRVTLTLAAGLGLAACGSNSPAPPGAAPSSPAASPGSPSPTPEATERTRLVYVSAAERDVWAYDLTTGSKRRLTSDGDERQELNPRFVDVSTVSYVVGDGIEMIDLGTGARTALVPVTTTSVRAFAYGHDWTADGKRFAYLAVAGTDEQESVRFDLVIAERTGKELSRTRLPILLPEGLGGYCFTNETRVSIARDGSLVVVELYKGADKNVVVLDGTGAILGDPLELRGTRIAPDGTILADGGAGWVRVDPKSTESSRLPVPAGTSRVELDADGSTLAYEELTAAGASPHATLSVVDLSSGARHEIAQQAGRPAWLSNDRLLVLTGDEAGCWELSGTPATLTIGSQPETLETGLVVAYAIG